MSFRIFPLYSGGLIVNYACSSKCGHCHYNSSPKRPKDYITTTTASRIFKFLKRGGCHSIHIGGGEPFLQIEKLKDVLVIAQSENINIEYIETNSSWYQSEQQTREVLKDLKKLGISTLLISISPLHNEYIPYSKVEGLINACNAENISVFPWIRDFAPDICRMDKNKTHSLQEYDSLFGENYTPDIVHRYGLSIGGRAIETFRKYYPKRNFSELLNDAPNCAGYFTNTSHFHVDLYGNYIPCHCVGFQFSIEDAAAGISESKYPFANAVFDNGISGAFEYAEKSGFKPRNQYISACELCEDIRLYLSTNTEHREIGPAGFYDEIETRGN